MGRPKKTAGKCDGMTLSQRLEQLPDDEIVYLGGKGGTGFIFIGTAAQLKESLFDVDREQKNSLKKDIRKAFRTLVSSADELESADRKKAAAMSALAMTTQAMTDVGVTADLKTIANANVCIESIQRSVKKAEVILSKKVPAFLEWVPLEDRPVMEDYPHHAEKAGTTLLISGNTLYGTYWLYSEAEADRQAAAKP